MPDQFSFPLKYKDEVIEYLVTLVRFPYSYQLQIEVENQTLAFEPDDSGGFRLIRLPWQNESDIKKIDVRLIEIIIENLNTIYNAT